MFSVYRFMKVPTLLAFSSNINQQRYRHFLPQPAGACPGGAAAFQAIGPRAHSPGDQGTTQPAVPAQPPARAGLKCWQKRVLRGFLIVSQAVMVLLSLLPDLYTAGLPAVQILGKQVYSYFYPVNWNTWFRGVFVLALGKLGEDRNN